MIKEVSESSWHVFLEFEEFCYRYILYVDIKEHGN